MTRARLATLVLRVDAAANLAAALACLALAGTVAGLLRLEATWPVVALAVLLAANGIACWTAGSRPAGTTLRQLAGVDAVFAAAVGLFALLDPTAMAAGTRWALVVVADLAVVVGVAKLLTARGAPQGAPVVAR